MDLYYTLDEAGNPTPCRDSGTWGRWMADNEARRVGATFIPSADGKITVSTMFLGINHRFDGEGAPVLFETMVFGGPMDGAQWRYETRPEAIAGHARVVKEVLAALEAILAVIRIEP